MTRRENEEHDDKRQATKGRNLRSNQLQNKMSRDPTVLLRLPRAVEKAAKSGNFCQTHRKK